MATGENEWRELAIRTLRSFVGEYRQWGQFAAVYANTVARARAEPIALTVVGPDGDPLAESLWRRARAATEPAVSFARIVPARDAERLRTLGFPADRSAAYVCVGTACSAPITDEASLARQLEETSQRHARAS